VPAGLGPVYVAVGASETVGTGSTQPLRDAWPRAFFRAALPTSTVFVNAGIPGSTVAQAIREEAPTAVDLRPDLVTVWTNVNDIIAGVPAGEFERQLETLVSTLRRGGATRVLVANVPPLERLPAYLACRPNPPPGGPPCRVGARLPAPETAVQVVDAYNLATARVVQRRGAFLVDLHAMGLAARQAGSDAGLVSGDGFHPSTAGHAAVGSAFADAFRRSGPLPGAPA
jgi:lysophospholipase L1-like esterase